MIEELNGVIRYRISDPKQFSKFRSKDIGEKGRMSMIVAYDGKGWKVQSYRFALKDYTSVTDVLKDAKTIKNISQSDLDKIASLTRKYFKSVNG